MSGSVILGYLATRDVAMVQRWPTLCRMTIIPLLYYAWAWLATGLTIGILFWCLCVFPLLLYLFWLSAAVISVRRTSHAGAPSQVATGKKPGRQGQRVGMLYNRYLGIRGKHFVWKVWILQLFTVVLQASSKVRIYAKGATIGSVITAMPTGFVKLVYQLFLVGLLVNCLYPPILLQARSVRLQREMAAKVSHRTREPLPHNCCNHRRREPYLCDAAEHRSTSCWIVSICSQT